MIFWVGAAIQLVGTAVSSYLSSRGGDGNGGGRSYTVWKDPFGRTWKQFRQSGYASSTYLNATNDQRGLFHSGAWQTKTGTAGGAPPLSAPAETIPISMPGATPGIVGPGANGGGVPLEPGLGVDGYPLAGNAPTAAPGGAPIIPVSTSPGGAIGAVATGFQIARYAYSILGPRRSGGETVGVRGTDFSSTGGYPAGASLEDLMEQTYTPDLWARRVARGIAILAAPIKRFYSVPMVDWEGDIEGRIRATGGPIKKSSIILYGGASDSDSQAQMIGPMLKGMHFAGYCEVVDEEGGGSDPTVGYVYARPKRRRGGIHVSAGDLRKLKSVQKRVRKVAKVAKKYA